MKNLARKRFQKENTKQILRESKRLKVKTSQVALIDQLYFETYQNSDIHQEMLNDIVRMEKYTMALEKVSKDSTIIDVGAGTGILSMLSAKFGAKAVYAIENSKIAEQAIESVKNNGLSNLINVIQEKAENIELGIDKVDIIISEWMGYFLLFENMLPSVLSVRNRYLKNDGIIIPNRALIFISGFQKDLNVHGLNFNFLNKMNSNQAKIEILKEENIITNNCLIFDFDLKIDNMDKSQFVSDFDLTVQKSGSLYGIVGWFDVFLLEDVILSTSPFEKETHWKQTIFNFDQPFLVEQGETVSGKFSVTTKANNHRALQFKIQIKEKMMNKSKTFSFVME